MFLAAHSHVVISDFSFKKDEKAGFVTAKKSLKGSKSIASTPTCAGVLSMTSRGPMEPVSECYQCLTAHQHHKGHTVPKQVITISTSIKSLQSKHCTV